MKTTIDIPDQLYRQAKIRAVQTGKTLKQLVLTSLTREIAGEAAAPPTPERSFWEKRTLLPAYEAALKAGAFRPPPGARDVTELISEDRDAR